MIGFHDRDQDRGVPGGKTRPGPLWAVLLVRIELSGMEWTPEGCGSFETTRRSLETKAQPTLECIHYLWLTRYFLFCHKWTRMDANEL